MRYMYEGNDDCYKRPENEDKFMFLMTLTSKTQKQIFG